MINNFVLENATNPGTGTVSLAGAPAGRRTFTASFTNGSICYYFIDDGAQAEAGYGTLTYGSPATLTRNVIWNTAGNVSPLNFAGTCRVYSSLPADRTMYSDQLNQWLARGRVISGVGPAADLDDAARLEQVGWQYIDQSVSSSTVSAVIFTLDPKYISHQFHITDASGSINGGLFCRLSVDGGVSYLAGASDYTTVMSQTASAGVSGFYTTGTFVGMTPAAPGTGTVFSGVIDLPVLNNNKRFAVSVASSTTMYFNDGAFRLNAGGTPTHIQIGQASGSFLAHRIRHLGMLI